MIITAFSRKRRFHRLHTMDFLAPISRNIIAPLWACWERSPYLRVYRNLLKTQYDPPEVVFRRQLDRMRDIARHAYATSSFWKDRFDAANLKPEDLREPDDLARLPLLSKTDIRDHGPEMRSSDYPDTKILHHFKTSGSTGVPVEIYSDEACAQFKRGAVLRSDEWSGWRLGERIASIWGNPKPRTDWRGRLRNLLLERRYVYLDTLKMDERNMRDFTEILLRTPPSLLFGHAHSLYLYAEYLRKHQPEIRIRPRGIISTCMVLHDYERQLISDAFGIAPTNRYGCEEVGLIASECERHEGLHVNTDCLYVELVDFQGNRISFGEPNRPGRILITDLLNRAMPLFRYEVGDTATWTQTSCSCGRTLPCFSRIEGRVADYVVTKSGNYVSGISLTENFACMVPGIAQLQIIQEDYDRFTFNIVKGGDFGQDSLDQIGRLVAERFGEDSRYECVFLDKIPQEPSGKYRFCISRVPH